MTPSQPRPRVMIGGIGLPWRRDLDLGRLLVEQLADADWPPGVIVEDLSYSAHRVMHTLEEVQPEKLVLVAATTRGGRPGTISRYPVDPAVGHEAAADRAAADDVVARLGESVGGVIDLDHILVVNRYFGTLPADTVVIEIEVGDESFGTGYSPSVDDAIPRILQLIREEAG